MQSSAPQNPSGATTVPPNFAEISGEIHITANTPRRAIAISSPMAIAISLPLNHLANIFETLVPSISQPQPNIMKPSEAIFALAGMLTHQLPSHWANPVVWNHSLTPTNLIAAPATISPAESTPEKRTPSLSRMTPAMIRKPHTFSIYSDAAYFPNTPLSQPRLVSTSDFSGDITSTNIYAKNIISATSASTVHRSTGESFISLRTFSAIF